MADDGRPAGGHPDIEPPLGDIPEFDRGELQSDTLAFERIKRRPPESMWRPGRNTGTEEQSLPATDGQSRASWDRVHLPKA